MLGGTRTCSKSTDDWDPNSMLSSSMVYDWGTCDGSQGKKSCAKGCERQLKLSEGKVERGGRRVGKQPFCRRRTKVFHPITLCQLLSEGPRLLCVAADLPEGLHTLWGHRFYPSLCHRYRQHLTHITRLGQRLISILVSNELELSLLLHSLALGPDRSLPPRVLAQCLCNHRQRNGMLLPFPCFFPSI